MTPLQPAVLGTNKLHACSTHAAWPARVRAPTFSTMRPSNWALLGGAAPRAGLDSPTSLSLWAGGAGPTRPAHIPLPILALSSVVFPPCFMVVVTPIPCCASRSLPAAK